MSNYKRGLVQDIYKKKEFQKVQEQLREKHHIAKEDGRIVVEKNNMVKFTVRTIGNFIRIIASILIFALALIGLASLIYPEPRSEMLVVWQVIYNQLKQYLIFLP